MNREIGFGGGCHWCTEAVFLSLKGILNVKQGWIAAKPPQDWFSEAILANYNADIITLKDLIEIHLHTHASTSNHSMRNKYRSAVYVFNEEEEKEAKKIILELQADFEQTLITEVLLFADFKSSLPEHLDYYYSNPDKPFCALYINPKLKMLQTKFRKLADADKIKI